MLPILFIALLVPVLQLTAVNYAMIGPHSFNLVLIVLVFFGLRRGLKVATPLGLFFGVVNGLFGTGSFWPNVLLYTMIGSVTGYIGQWFYRDDLSAFLIMVLASLGFMYLISIPSAFFRLFLPAALYNTAISVFLFYFLREITT